ncbi:MAG TPA: hypothetical protein VK911_09795 [Vicinamibacterales bacterium]|nr:hypothetical protein [Vicinamibacterales bacterium]
MIEQPAPLPNPPGPKPPDIVDKPPPDPRPVPPPDAPPLPRPDIPGTPQQPEVGAGE